jgi:hypothetical protein
MGSLLAGVRASRPSTSTTLLMLQKHGSRTKPPVLEALTALAVLVVLPALAVLVVLPAPP